MVACPPGGVNETVDSVIELHPPIRLQTHLKFVPRSRQPHGRFNIQDEPYQLFRF